jgi:hypothetical protein
MQRLQEAIRPTLKWKDQDGEFCLLKGIPTGSPIQPLMLNLYLGVIDGYFERYQKDHPHVIYCRYGDDFFFAHPDEALFLQAKAGFLNLVTELELETRPEKIKSFRWSGSGFKGRSMVEFLGYDLRFNGTLRINSPKQTLLRKHLSRVVRRTFAVMKDYPMEARITEARKGLERTLGIASPSRHPYLDKIFTLANDRSQLSELDHEISRALAQAISGIPNTRAFRKVSKKKLYQEHKIPSLVGRRNETWKP